MRALVLSCLLLAGCSTDTYGLGADLEASVTDDTAADDSSVSGDDTSPLFDADEDSSIGDSGTTDTASSDAGGAEATVDAASEVAVDGEPEVLVDVGPEIAVDAEPEVLVDAGPEITPIDTGAPDTGTVTPFLPDPGKVVCADGSGGTKLCGAGQTCCGDGGTYTCKSTCGLLDKKYRCDEKADCGGQVCCAVVVFGSYEGSDCRDSWLCGTTLCQKDADCGTGKKCEPFKPSGAPYTMGRCP